MKTCTKSFFAFCDVVHVRAKEVDIEVTERMVEYTWFPTLGKFKNIVLGMIYHFTPQQ